jgi:hypothetical protein
MGSQRGVPDFHLRNLKLWRLYAPAYRAGFNSGHAERLSLKLALPRSDSSTVKGRSFIRQILSVANNPRFARRGRPW